MDTGKNREDGEDQQRDRRRLWPTVVNIISSYAAYYRRQHQKPDDPLAHRIGHFTRVTAYGTWAGALLAGAAAFIFWCQLQATQDQIRKSENASRPWVAGDGIPAVKNLKFSEQSGLPLLNFTVPIVVLGEHPARSVFGVALILPENDTTALFDMQRDFCKGFEEKVPDGKTMMGRTVLPGQRTEIEVKGIGKRDAFPAALKAGKSVLMPIVFGCIVYEIQDNTVHSTGFIYDISLGEKTGNFLTPIPFAAGLEYSAGKLKFFPDDWGDGMAD